MKYRVVTVKLVKPHLVLDRYPVLENHGFNDGVVDIQTTEQLTSLIKDLKFPVIIYGYSCYGPKGACLLEIYDEYRE